MESNNMKEFIADLPKAELHLHIEGTLSPQTILKLTARNNIDFPYKSVEAIKDALANRPPGLVGFLDHHYLAVNIIQTEADFYEVTYELLRTCKENNIVYEDGYRFTSHCDVDQTNSVQHIWECLDILKVERIDHGINSIEDPLLVEELKRRNICLTPCPIWRSTDPAPQDVDRIKKMFELGLLVTLNTDDPAEFDTGYLTNMLIEVQEASGYSKGDLVRYMWNAFEGSWLPRSEKDAYIESLLQYAAAHGVTMP